MAPPEPSHARLPALLFWAFALVWVALAIAPRYRQDWLLENLLIVVAVPLLAWSYRRLRFSNLAYASLFAFLVLHEIGAHYTYAEVPYDRWARSLAGFSPDALLGFSRNHYDRLVHFLYGLLVTPAAFELIAARSAPATRFWRWLLPLSFVASHAVLFELVEWAAALAFAGELGEAYLGTQGDPWDAQSDMFLAVAGSAITASVLAWRASAPVQVPMTSISPDRA